MDLFSKEIETNRKQLQYRNYETVMSVNISFAFYKQI